jgi:hypothetical protein
MNEEISCTEELLDCVLTIDELLSEMEEMMDNKQYSDAMRKLHEAKEAIADLKIDDEALDDRQEVDMHVANILK